MTTAADILALTLLLVSLLTETTVRALVWCRFALGHLCHENLSPTMQEHRDSPPPAPLALTIFFAAVAVVAVIIEAQITKFAKNALSFHSNQQFRALTDATPIARDTAEVAVAPCIMSPFRKTPLADRLADHTTPGRHEVPRDAKLQITVCVVY